MSFSAISRLAATAFAAVILALAGTGCSALGEAGGGQPPVAQDTTPDPPKPCATQPPGRAQDGTNDDQGGSVPGVDPCDGPGN